mmetsp:Transcript_26070/g.47289  ORF Transcript_26070/g.47289 Transcript_26070/m.47289 type:complete len:284 (+) Transcript_26070:99-950(+)
MNNAQAQQFAALQKATTTFSNETKTADHMRRREVDLMNREQEQQRRLEEELRVSHGALGEETRTEKNLEIERKRYRQATEADRHAIVKITSELKGTEAEEKEQKTQFVKEMESLATESDYLLSRRENNKTSALLDAEHVNWLIENKLDVLANRNDSMEAASGNEKWSDITTRVKEELAGMVEDGAKEEAALKENNELEPFLQQLRAKVLSENNSWGQMEIEDIENKWDQQYINYPEEQGENTTNANASKPQEPVHMELFYNNQEYGNGPVYDTNAANNIGHAC